LACPSPAALAAASVSHRSRLREHADDELAFHEDYYANLDKVYAFLAKRFA